MEEIKPNETAPPGDDSSVPGPSPPSSSATKDEPKPEPTTSTAAATAAVTTTPTSTAASETTFNLSSLAAALPTTGLSESLPTATFKVVLVGDGGVGKSAWLHRHLTGEFLKPYNPTVGVDVRQVVLNTSRGKVALNVWDCAGQERFAGLRDGYYICASAAILMFEVTNRLSYKNLGNWYKPLVRVCDDIPIVLLGNKVEQHGDLRKVRRTEINFHRRHRHMQYYDVSAKSGYNLDRPLLWLLRSLCNDVTLTLVDHPELNTQGPDEEEDEEAGKKEGKAEAAV